MCYRISFLKQPFGIGSIFITIRKSIHNIKQQVQQEHGPFRMQANHDGGGF